MRRQFVAQIAGCNAIGTGAVGGLLAQLAELAQQQFNVLLLTHDDLVQTVHQVFGEAGFDFQVGQAGLDIVRRFQGLGLTCAFCGVFTRVCRNM